MLLFLNELKSFFSSFFVLFFSPGIFIWGFMMFLDFFFLPTSFELYVRSFSSFIIIHIFSLSFLNFFLYIYGVLLSFYIQSFFQLFWYSHLKSKVNQYILPFFLTY